MKVKLGQWARDDNRLFMITEQITCKCINMDISYGTNKLMIANTPQELIRVGDLVTIRS